MIVIFTWILAVVSIVGAILNARKNRWGFIIWIFGSAGWITVAIVYELYAQIPLWIVLAVTSIYGFCKWTNDSKNTKDI